VLGLATLAAYMKIGMSPEVQAGERFVPAWVDQSGEHAP